MFGDVLGINQETLQQKLLTVILYSKGIINDKEMDWINNINYINKDVIFNRLKDPKTSGEFFKMMSQITYKEFEAECRKIVEAAK